MFKKMIVVGCCCCAFAIAGCTNAAKAPETAKDLTTEETKQKLQDTAGGKILDDDGTGDRSAVGLPPKGAKMMERSKAAGN